MPRWAAVFVMGAWLAGTPARAEVVRLKDGTRLSGTIRSAAPDHIELETPNGTMRVRRDRIAGIDFGAAPAAAVPPSAPPAAEPWRAYREPWEKPVGAGSSFLSLGLGMDIPISRVDLSGAAGGGKTANGDVGPLVAIQYLYQLDRRVGLGAEFDYLNRSRTESFSAVSDAITNVSGDSVLFLGVGRVLLRDEGNARPYLLAALGAHRTALTVDATPQFGFSWADTGTDETRRFADDDAWGLASSLRLGVDFFAASPAILGVELGWTRIDTATYGATSAGRAQGLDRVRTAIHLITLAGRLGFTL
ncbi:MAG: hypothetical protein PHF00_12160 [Elusimicrobia bacterium]|nr:hypothetical protein [Elusimicrobiota bacterium]